MKIMDRMIDLTGNWLAELGPDNGLSEPVIWLKRRGGYAFVNRLVGSAIPFAPRNRFAVEEVRTGYVRARIAIKGNKNHFGSLYAGAYFVVAEIPGGVLTLFDLGPAYVPILKEMTLAFLKPSDTDVIVEMSLTDAELTRIREESDATGRAAFTLTGELRDETGEIVARSTAHYRVKKKGFTGLE
ncbi:PaaI family thioesterase [Marinobacter sp. V034]|uniref:PaaI family thioesterase n=1 Tax=Marinobacter sp. V034 TaxID=3459610 RepID=UPI0040447695